MAHCKGMTTEQIPKFLMRIFAPRNSASLLLKPAAVLAVYLCCYLLWEFIVIGWAPVDLPRRLLVVTLTQVPFLAIAFTLVIYLDRMQSGLTDLAMTDGLTNLPNRRAFIKDVTARQSKGDIGYLLIIDADHFKRINDTYGHPVGDTCLQAISARLQSLITPPVIIGRIGGEEFGAYFPYHSENDILLIGRRLCQEIVVERPGAATPLRLTLSVGATETRPNEMVVTALTRADAALYAAKEAGRARLVLWSPALAHAA